MMDHRSLYGYGEEFGCHGDRWASPIGLSQREEAAMIARAVARHWLAVHGGGA